MSTVNFAFLIALPKSRPTALLILGLIVLFFNSTSYLRNSVYLNNPFFGTRGSQRAVNDQPTDCICWQFFF
ncbi:hypothetical protein SUGI_0317570 [Cryptomeria japonica]|nr:hypothetical protein SUGI_0317570 [Cryptomeria japonica]